jgi:myo-inositol-1(or 4)-monophosphatase
LQVLETLSDMSWQAEHDLLRDSVREAGELALRMFRSGVDAWDKQDGTPLSEADLAVDSLLAKRLRQAQPDFGWLSEETTREDTTRQMENVWVVDPIDGTSAFVGGTKQWCVGACLLNQGRPVSAVAYAPAQSRLYEARLGSGALLNGKVIQVSNRHKLDGASFVAHKSAINSNRWKAPVPGIKCAMTTSLILRHCLVATGEYDGAIAFGKKHDWDLAPGDLIVHEAGGQTLDLDGAGFVYNRDTTRQNGMMAGSRALLDEMAERLHTSQK